MEKRVVNGFFDTLFLSLAVVGFALWQDAIIVRVGFCICVILSGLELFFANSVRPAATQLSQYHLTFELSILFAAFLLGSCANIAAYEWVFIIGITVASDAGGLAFGKAVDGRKVELLEHISPNKTYIGYIGEALCSWVVGIMIIMVYKIDLNSSRTIFLVSAWLFAAIGDLVGSICKRGLFIKDSDEIMKRIPIIGKVEMFARSRHGFLDCFDSMTVVFLYYLTLAILERSLT